MVAVGLAVIVALNILLLHLLHLQIHQRAEAVVQRVAKLPTELRTETNIAAIAQQFKFEYVPDDAPLPEEASQFSAAGISLNLVHPAPYQKHAYIILFFNILFFGLLVFVYRWWQVYRVRPRRFLSDNKLDSHDNSILSTVDPKAADSSLFKVFLLIRWTIKLEPGLDEKSHFSVAIHKHLPSSMKCSVKYLNSGALAVTFENIAWGDVIELGKKLHEVMFRTLRSLRGDLSRKQIKVGGCFYQNEAEQANVYQLARAALEIANNNVWQHVHMMPLDKTHENAMQNSEDDFVRCIKNGQFVLFFQPLFGFEQQDIIQSEVLLRVRHAQLGLIAAKQFIPQLHSKDNLETLDKTILSKAISILSKEPHKSDVSINLHIENWVDIDFIHWLIAQIRDTNQIKKLTFEVCADDYYKYHQQINVQQLFFTGVNVALIIDHVESPLIVNILRENQLISAVKLGFGLVHKVHLSTQQQKTIKQIVYQAKRLKVAVYAVGVESQAELDCLKSLGVDGAQGYYFAELLQQLELVRY